MRRAESIEEANKILLEAVEEHLEDGTIQFNLGCYACQMEDLETARERVATAIKIDKTFKALALEDPDLEGLWGSLGS